LTTDKTSDFGQSVLISACYSEDGDPELVQYLLTNPAIQQTINYQIRGGTIRWRIIFRLMRFLYRNKIKTSKLVFAMANTSGSTALQVAVRRGNTDVVNVLLQHGADPSLKNDLGLQAIDFCEAFPELRGALKRVIHQKKGTRNVNLHRRNSTASNMGFPMYLVPLDQLDMLYGGKEPRHNRIEAHQELKRRGELMRWEDLPIDAHIIFLSHEWVGWNHPDPHGIQLKTFLRVMKRLRSGEISQVEMSVFHIMSFKQNHVVKSDEWKELLDRAYETLFHYLPLAMFSLSLSLSLFLSISQIRKLFFFCFVQIRVDRLGIDATAKCMSTIYKQRRERQDGIESRESGKIDPRVCRKSRFRRNCGSWVSSRRSKTSRNETSYQDLL
jgi:hypothetical protein